MMDRFTRSSGLAAMCAALLSGCSWTGSFFSSDKVAYETDPVFNLQVPKACPDVPTAVLTPKTTWSDQAAYTAQAAKLAKMFVDNFKEFESAVSPDVKAAGPKA